MIVIIIIILIIIIIIIIIIIKLGYRMVKSSPQSALDEATDPWGVKVERVEVSHFIIIMIIIMMIIMKR